MIRTRISRHSERAALSRVANNIPNHLDESLNTGMLQISRNAAFVGQRMSKDEDPRDKSPFDRPRGYLSLLILMQGGTLTLEALERHKHTHCCLRLRLRPVGVWTFVVRITI